MLVWWLQASFAGDRIGEPSLSFLPFQRVYGSGVPIGGAKVVEEPEL